MQFLHGNCSPVSVQKFYIRELVLNVTMENVSGLLLNRFAFVYAFYGPAHRSVFSDNSSEQITKRLQSHIYDCLVFQK